jgi:hypothetical protein
LFSLFSQATVDEDKLDAESTGLPADFLEELGGRLNLPEVLEVQLSSNELVDNSDSDVVEVPGNSPKVVVESGINSLETKDNSPSAGGSHKPIQKKSGKKNKKRK